MKKIVVGFDGTDQARDALHLGAAIAGAFEAQLIVASAIGYGSNPIFGTQGYEGYDTAKAEHYERVFNQARAELGSAEFERRELQDTAAHGLTDLAEHEQADLIVVGSTHHGLIGRVLTGAVAAQLLQGAPCGVMVAPRGWSEREHTGLGLIGVGYDGSDEARMAIARAEDLARAFGAKLRVITIAPYIGPHGEFAPTEDLRPNYAEIVKQGVRAVSDDVETERALLQGRAATELALQGVELDLLVLGSRGYGPLRRTLVGSVSGEVARTVPCPVLVVPRSAEARADVEPAPEAAVAS